MQKADTQVDKTEDHICDGSCSYGQHEKILGCKCRPSNVLYWELSEADNSECFVHNPKLMFSLPEGVNNE